MTQRTLLTRCLALLIAVWTAGAMLPHSAAAQSPLQNETITYTVRRGDTLIDLARSWMIRETDWKPVQTINRVANPNRLPVASQLAIPVRLLKFRPASATVAAFRGEAQAATASGAFQRVAMGQVLGEGARIATGPASSLSLTLTDGSVITLPSNSTLRFTRLRKLLITDSIDYELALDKGTVRSRVSPFRNSQDRFRLRNPIAVSAVRGTDFRSHYDERQEQARAELIEGGLALTGPASASETRLDERFGAIIGKVGRIAVERLLPPPVLVTGGGLQRAPTLPFGIAPVPGARGYRLLIGRDSGFIDIVEDISATAPEFLVPSLDNGNYFARFTAISETGLEGLPGTFAFRRRLATSTAGASAGADGYVFRWVGAGEGTRRYRFQLRAENDATFIVDEAGLSASSIILSDLPPGRYMWRVGTTTFASEETENDWTEYDSFMIDE